MRYKTTSTNRGCCMMSGKGCQGCSKKKQSSYDWLSDIPEALKECDIVEVQFKNTRKGYYHNAEGLELYKGDIVSVESSPGYDVGEVTLTGKLVQMAMKKHRQRTTSQELLPKLLRIASTEELSRWQEAQSREERTMIEARQIAEALNLDMKIGDVEYQGDGTKAIFYYIAEGRIDFRQLIRVLADAFRVRIEMKQIGARQEAGRIGGIGPCGRELCCASWASNFASVNTNAARVQDISPNPQKLAGMCGKLKCCLNYEVNTYAEAQRQIPNRDIVLQTRAGLYHFFKADYLQRLITYSTTAGRAENLLTIPAKRAYEIIEMNKAGAMPDTLTYNNQGDIPKAKSSDILSDNSLTRFDSPKTKRKSKDGDGQGRDNRPPRPRSNTRGAESPRQQMGEGKPANRPRPKPQHSRPRTQEGKESTK